MLKKHGVSSPDEFKSDEEKKAQIITGTTKLLKIIQKNKNDPT